MKKEEVTKWLTIMKANLNSFPEVSNAKKIEALGEAIRLLKNEQSIDKIDCEHTECRNCTNHKYCDYEISSSEKPNRSENSTSSDCVDRHSVDLLTYRYLREPTDNHVAFYEDFLDLPSVTPQEPTARNDNQILEDIKNEILEQYWGDSREEYFNGNDSKEYIDGAIEAADYIIKMIGKHKKA